MSGDWSKYNGELVKSGEILISPTDFGLKPKDKPAGVSQKRRDMGRGL